MESSHLHERLTAAAANRSYRNIAEITSTHPESVRRYMQGQSPSAEFLMGFCRALHINANWLLTGQGPMRTDDLRNHALREADASELLGAMAETIEHLIERVERIELFVQNVDIRLRARAGAEGTADSPHGHTTPAPAVETRIRKLLDAVRPAPPSDAH